MTPLAQAVSSLPDSQLVKMVSALVGDQVAGLIHNSLHNPSSAVKTKEEVEKLRNLDLVKLLPNVEKQKIDQMCDKALGIIELVP